MMMFRPWRQDPRPVWYVKTTWRTLQSLDEYDRERLLKTLTDTGHIRAPALEVGAGRLTLSMLVHAGDHGDAEHTAVRVAEVAYQAAGLGELDMHIACAAHCTSRHGGRVA
jgi:hypothetical protein